MKNFVPETCYFVPSSAGEFNAIVDVTLRSTGQHPTGWGEGVEGGDKLGIEIFFVAEAVQKLG